MALAAAQLVLASAFALATAIFIVFKSPLVRGFFMIPLSIYFTFIIYAALLEPSLAAALLALAAAAAYAAECAILYRQLQRWPSAQS
jgi:hypothetical protein